jgi:hypothetical protein
LGVSVPPVGVALQLTPPPHPELVMVAVRLVLMPVLTEDGLAVTVTPVMVQPGPFGGLVPQAANPRAVTRIASRSTSSRVRCPSR